MELELSYEELMASTPDQMYDLVQKGNIPAPVFYSWIGERVRSARDAGYAEGWYNGHEDGKASAGSYM